jgi:hypothetical protein
MFAGSLQDSGERISLTKPGDPSTNSVPHIVKDSVRYNDKAPWPPAADGSGASLQRISPMAYADDPTNWMAGAPTPGRANAGPDGDGDGMPDAWEIANGTQVGVPDANADPDGDGFTNLQEYLAGTDPLDPQSHLRVLRVESLGSAVRFQFSAISNRTYTIQFRDSLMIGNWSVMTNVTAWPYTRTLSITDPATNSARFYRLAAP